MFIKIQSKRSNRKAAILTTELLLIMVVLIGGLTAILSKLSDSVKTELNNAAGELHNVIGRELKTAKPINSITVGQGETIVPAREIFNPPTP